MRSRGGGGRVRAGSAVLGPFRGVAGRGWSCRHFVPWSGRGSGCLRGAGVTDESEGVVVVLAEQAHPVVVTGPLLAT